MILLIEIIYWFEAMFAFTYKIEHMSEIYCYWSFNSYSENYLKLSCHEKYNKNMYAKALHFSAFSHLC